MYTPEKYENIIEAHELNKKIIEEQSEYIKILKHDVEKYKDIISLYEKKDKITSELSDNIKILLNV